MALVNLELNEPVLELGTSYYCDPLKGSSSTLLDADPGLDIEEDGGESSGNGGDFDG